MQNLFMLLLWATTPARATAPNMASTPERAMVCHKLLITPSITALAWTPENRLAPVQNRSRAPVHSLTRQLGGHWISRRLSRVIPLAIHYDAHETVLGTHAGWLPSKLEKILRQNGRFVTSPNATGPYSLWMLVPPGGRRGRTGVLLYHGRPIVIKDPSTQAEYLVELKGAGLPRGGYVNDENYSSIQGGLWDQHAQIEYHRTQLGEAIHQGEGVYGLGYQRFASEHGEQEILFRLTPGNLRASYRANPMIPRPAAVRIMTAMGTRLGEILSIGYGAQTHGENFVVDLAQERAFLTDYLDVMPLWDPENFTDLSAPTLRYLMALTMAAPEFYHGFQGDEDLKTVSEAVGESLVRQGFLPDKILEPSLAGKPFEFTARILDAGLARRIVIDRQDRGLNAFANRNLREVLARPCGEPDPEHSFWKILELGPPEWFNPSGLKNHPYAPIFHALTAYHAGTLSLDALLLNKGVHDYLNLNRRLRLKPPGPPSNQKKEKRFFVELSGRKASPFLESCFPGLEELKATIEDEAALLRSASYSHPQFPELARAQAYLARLIAFYKNTTLTQFRDLITNDRATFRKLFIFPHHADFDPKFLDEMFERMLDPEHLEIVRRQLGD